VERAVSLKKIERRNRTGSEIIEEAKKTARDKNKKYPG
jgi:hypothetical protein